MVNKKNRDYAQRFSMRFRLLMSYHNLTLQDIAQKTGSAVSTVGTWKNGRIPSNPAVIESIAKVFDVSVEFLLEGRARGVSSPDMQHASRILRDIDDLLRELGEEDFIREPEEVFDAGLPETHGVANSKQLQRMQIEAYFKHYLDNAENHPDGLSFTWILMKRDFPLDLYDKMKP